MQPAEFQFCADLLKKRSGLALSPDKQYLMETRLLPIARQHGCEQVSGLIKLVRDNGKDSLLNEITEAMTTNESLFFRDAKPFEYLRQTLLPRYKELEKKHVRIWSAACSTGQEPYSIAMCLQEDASRMPGWRYDITGTDLARKVITKAKEGTYSQFEVQRGLPIQMLIKYFNQLPGTLWQVKDTVRQMVNYRTQNLLEDFSILGKFDIIFCRNVLIYFDEPTKATVIERLRGSLNPGGYLFIGSTETILNNRQWIAQAECRGAYRTT